MADRLRLLGVALLVATTALFVIGTTVEKDSHDESTETVSEEADETEGAHSEEGESEEAHADEGESEEATIFGLDRESNGLIVAAAVMSLVLAALVWFRPRREAWIAVVVLGLAFAVFDVDEVRHQLDESENGLALLAAAVAVGHVLTAGVGVAGLRRGDA